MNPRVTVDFTFSRIKESDRGYLFNEHEIVFDEDFHEIVDVVTTVEAYYIYYPGSTNPEDPEPPYCDFDVIKIFSNKKDITDQMILTSFEISQIIEKIEDNLNYPYFDL